MKKFRGFMILLLVVIVSANVFADTSDEQMERIYRDIEIMENVLDKLIIKESPLYFNFDDHVKGIYLKGFGLLFDVESFGLSSVSTFINKTIKNIAKIDVKGGKDRSITIDINRDGKIKAEEDDESVKEKIDETRELLMKFYKDYASSIKSLNPDDRICVNIRIGNNLPFISISEDEEINPSQFRSVASVFDLSEYRKGKISEAKLEKKIKFTEIYGDDSDRDIDIMEKILDTSLEMAGVKKLLGLSGHTRGLYLDEFGVLFFSPTGLLERNIRVMAKNVAKAGKRAEETKKRVKEHEKRIMKYKKDLDTYVDSMRFSFSFDIDDFDFNFHMSKAEIDSIVNEMRDDILELIGQYGHTLKKIKDDEFVMVAVDLNGGFWGEDISRLYIKVKKEDINKYNRDQIDFNSFKESARMWQD